MEDRDIEKTLSELESYINEVKAFHGGRIPEKKSREDLESLVPKQRIAKRFPAEEPPEKPGIRHSAGEAVPYLSLETAADAVAALSAMRERERIEFNFAVTCLSDEGDKFIRLAETQEEAKAIMKEIYDAKMKRLMKEDSARPTYIQETPGSVTKYEPTPLKYVNDDESYKSEAYADGKIHGIEDEDGCAIYNEATKEIFRIDIFDISDIQIRAKKKEDPEE